jgi:hypothetical protein
MGIGLGDRLDTRIDCWCRTCNAYVTVEEVRTDAHTGHEFGPEDQAALQAVRDYLRGREKRRAADSSEPSI